MPSGDDPDVRKVNEMTEDDYEMLRVIEDDTIGEGTSRGMEIPDDNCQNNQWLPSVLNNGYESQANDPMAGLISHDQNCQPAQATDMMFNNLPSFGATINDWSYGNMHPVIQQRANQNTAPGTLQPNQGLYQSENQFGPLMDWLTLRETKRKIESEAPNRRLMSSGRRAIGESSNNVGPGTENHIVDHVTIPYSYMNRTAIASTRIIYQGDDLLFKEVGCFHSAASKVLCCHFASSGSYLASGHDKKAFIYNLKKFQLTNTPEEHTGLISDVRFQPESTEFATSSLDGTVKIWDANRPRRSNFTYNHHAPVTSIDFHPSRTAMLCSSDINGGIRLWNADQSYNHVSMIRGGTRQIRFQPFTGELLATTEGNRINMIDVNRDISYFYLEGHEKDVQCISWAMWGRYIVSVSEDSARFWSVDNGSCIHVLQSKEMNSYGRVTRQTKFHSCTFHPGFLGVAIIGCDKGLLVWNPVVSSRAQLYQGHGGIVATLAGSHENELVASGSHDQWVKLWK